jgi:hypothetical protein
MYSRSNRYVSSDIFGMVTSGFFVISGAATVTAVRLLD